MAQPTRPVAELVDFSGGLNSAEPPDQIGASQVADVRNLEYRRTRGLKRRRGSVLNLTGTPFGAAATVTSLFRHTPGQSETGMELWAVSNDPGVARVAAGSAWSALIPFSDAIASAAASFMLRGVSFNGKLFLPYDSSTDRLHVWDGVQVRRVGLGVPAAAPTVANTGAGAYPAVARFYKIQYYAADPGSMRLVYSPLSDASTVFTPSGAGAAARVTRPALLGDHETRWVVYGSTDGVNYYRLSDNATAATFWDDANLPSTYPQIAPTLAGFPVQADYYTPPISVKYILVDGAQLLLAGSHETIVLSSTVFYTPALNTTGFNVTDDERVPSTNRIEIEPQLGGGITGLGGPIGGTPVVFKIDRTYLLNPTSDPTRPYTRQLLSDAVGCVSYQGIVLAEDEGGNPSLYWPARRGYYRYGGNGLEYCGADIEDFWATVALEALYGVTAAYHRDAGQIIIHAPHPDGSWSRLKFHVARGRSSAEGVRGGWTRDDGPQYIGVCMFSDAPGGTMGLRLKPYVGEIGDNGRVYKADAAGVNRDRNDATPYTAYVQTHALDHGIGEQFGVQNVYVQGVAETAPVTLNVSVRRNFDAVDSVPAVPVTLATQRGAVSASGLELSECEYLQIRITDQAALNQHWSLDRIGVRVRAEAPKE